MHCVSSQTVLLLYTLHPNYVPCQRADCSSLLDPLTLSRWHDAAGALLQSQPRAEIHSLPASFCGDARWHGPCMHETFSSLEVILYNSVLL